MNKSAFFAELNRSLAQLSKDEREDILRDMEEHFHEGSKRGLSEEEIIDKLGSPKKICDTIVAEAKVKRISTATTVSQKMAAIFAATIAIIVLAPFTFIFICIPLFFIFMLLCGLWPVAFVLAFSLPFILIALVIMMFQIGFHLLALLCLLFFALGWVSMVFAFVVGLAFLTVLLFKGIVKLFQWNIEFVKKQMRS